MGLEQLELRQMLTAVRELAGFSASTLPADSDFSLPVELGFELHLFGTTLDTLVVGLDGAVMFPSNDPDSNETPLPTVAGQPLSELDHPAIAPFWANIAASSADVTYGFDQVDGRPAFGATWTDAAPAGGETAQGNTFQVVLIDRSDVAAGAFDIEFNYDRIIWDTTRLGVGEFPRLATARAGVTDGSGDWGAFFELIGSGNSGALFDANPLTGLVGSSFQSEEPGRYRFEVRDTTMLNELGLTGQQVPTGDGGFFLGQGIPSEEVRWITTFNANAGDTINADELLAGGASGLALSGTNVVVGVWDEGAVRATHRELAGRVTVVDTSAALSDHATHVAGTLVATGLDPIARGIAPGATVRSYDWINDLDELRRDANLLDVTNHSYGQNQGWILADWDGDNVPDRSIWLADRATLDVESPAFGRYDELTRDWDALLADQPTVLSVWAAGNDRDDTFVDFGDGLYTTEMSTGFGAFSDPGWYLVPNVGATSAPPADGNGGAGFDTLPPGGGQTAKNTLVVGAVPDVLEDPRPTLGLTDHAPFSDWGPTDDGRVKPDLVANGVSLHSAVSAGDAAYDGDPGLGDANEWSGTSMAAPGVAGAAALLSEHYQDLFGRVPRAATQKAVLIHNAQDAYHPGPDYAFGWGLVDARASADFLSEVVQPPPRELRRMVEGVYSSSVQTFDVNVVPQEPLKVTLVWHDPAGTAQQGLDNRQRVLVNDLDLSIVGPGGVHLPWTLDVNQPDQPAVRTQRNQVDNVEQVVIDQPAAGTYTIRLNHTGTLADDQPQPFSLVISGAELTWRPDEFEPNDTLAEASVLGSLPEITLRNATIHDAEDQDFYEITAHQTGRLLVRAAFRQELGDLDLRVLDDAGNVLAESTSATDDEQIVIPVVGQQRYFIQVVGVDGSANGYALEIENFAAPTVTGIDLPGRDQNGLPNDTGISDSDNITSLRTPEILIETDLSEMIAAGIPVLSAQQAAAAASSGVAIEVFASGTSVGFADVVPGTNATLFRFRFPAGSLPRIQQAADSGGTLDQITAAVRVFDQQADEEGVPAPATGRGPLSGALRLVVDTARPSVSLPDLLDSSDSGVSSTDNISAINRPAFQGTAEANAAIRIFANGELVGQGTATTDPRLNQTTLVGQWEITVEPLRWGEYLIEVEAEDRAGNVSRAGSLRVVIDPYEPNDLLSQATVLGSDPAIVLRDLVLHQRVATEDPSLIRQLTQSGTELSAFPDSNRDGTRIVFQSTADFLGRNADRGFEIFLIDDQGTITQLTESSTGQSFSPVIDDAGTRVAFISDADLTGDNADQNEEVFLYDAQQGLRQITNTTGAENGGISISGNGRRIAFASTANLTSENPEGNPEIFFWDQTSGFFQLTLATSTVSRDTTINADGTRIAFQSTANLVTTNGDETNEIYLWEQGVGLRQLTDTARNSLAPTMDASGQRIAFVSDADLTGGNALNRAELFWFEDGAGFRQITTNSGPNTLNFDADWSADGTRLVFSSTADLTGQNPEGNAELFVHAPDTPGAPLTQLTQGGACGGAAADADGSRIVFFCESNLTGENPDEEAELFLWETGTAESLPDDLDLFKYTASHTGRVIVNLFSDAELVLNVRDGRGNLLATRDATRLLQPRNRATIILPSVTQQDYYLEVAYADPEAERLASAVYDLEIENFAAPVPNQIELPARDQNETLNDTGTVVLDDVTFRADPEILIHADLTDFATRGITVLSAPAAASGNLPGVAVEVFVDGNSVGFADAVTGTANTLFRFQLDASDLRPVNFPADSAGDLFFVSAAVRVFDPQRNASGVLSPVSGRTLLGEPLRLRVDGTPPAATTPDLISSSDSGWLDTDNVTRITAPTFQGTAEHNSLVRLYAQDVTDPNNPGAWQLVGQTQAGSDLSDGVAGNPAADTAIDHAGVWQITAALLDDQGLESSTAYASYRIRAEVEDLAGNVATTDSLQIWVDRREPALPDLDLIADDDSGRHNDDDVTNVAQPTLAVTFSDTPEGQDNPFPNQLFFRLYDRFTPAEDGISTGEQLLHQGPLGEAGFTRLDLAAIGVTLADGTHRLRLQTEDLAGNVSPSFVLELVIDTVAPTATVQLAPDSDTGVWGYPATMQDRITSDKSPQLTGATEANAVVRAQINGAPAGTAVAVPIDGNHAFPPPAGFVGNYHLDTILPLADGEQQVELFVEDLAGNGRDTVAATLDFFVDTQGPKIEGVTWGDVSRRGVFTMDENRTSVFREKPAGGPDPLISSIVVHFHDLPARSSTFDAAAVWEALAAEEGHYRLVGDANGEIPIQRVIVRRVPATASNETASNGAARATVELVFHDPGADGQLFTDDDIGAPLPDDRLTLTISDAISDAAGNRLDGESGAAAPFIGNPLPDASPPVFPTGDGQHGGSFAGRFTVDSRAEIGVWSAGSVYLDLNGNFQFDPANADAVNRDIAHTFGLTSDYVFAGNFAHQGQADGYDKLASYGSDNGQFRWMLDTNNDANPDIIQFDPANLVGMPVAGVFNRSRPGDQVGLFTGRHWYGDVSGDVRVSGEAARASTMTGHPVAGDFDRDGVADLATWDVRANRFQISLSSEGAGLANPQRYREFSLDAGFPFIGVRERPVAADFDGDGYDDLGLWVPDRSGAAPDELAEWFLLLSHGRPITARIEANNAIKFTPTPFGPDLYAQFGDEFGVPVVGNFDPPSVLAASDDVPSEPVANDDVAEETPSVVVDPPRQDTAPDPSNQAPVVADGVTQDIDVGDDPTDSAGDAADQDQPVSDPRDVNGDGFVTPRDALLVLNEVNRIMSADAAGSANPASSANSAGSANSADDSATDMALDVNRDGFVTPLDALLVLNHVNATMGTAAVDRVFASLDTDQGGQANAGASAASNLSTPVPRAFDQRVVTNVGQPVTISVMAAELASSAAWMARILQPPKYGTAEVDALGRIVYQPAPGFAGEDPFTYVLEDRSNRQASARVLVEVTRE